MTQKHVRLLMDGSEQKRTKATKNSMNDIEHVLNLPVITAKEPPMRRLSLSEYAEFNAFFLKNTDRQQIQRQKEGEEVITKRFRIVDEESQ